MASIEAFRIFIESISNSVTWATAQVMAEDSIMVRKSFLCDSVSFLESLSKGCEKSSGKNTSRCSNWTGQAPPSSLISATFQKIGIDLEFEHTRKVHNSF